MFKKTNKNVRSQALLDFILVFGILAAFLVGLMHIWLWFNTNFAKRNVDYQYSREAAGKANDATHRSIEGIYKDETLPINDDWVFKGKYDGPKVPLPPGAIEGDIPDDPPTDACTIAKAAAADLRAQAKYIRKEASDLDFGCCSHFCRSCERKERSTKQKLRREATALEKQAKEMEDAACP